jgi:hypothetical protein
MKDLFIYLFFIASFNIYGYMLEHRIELGNLKKKRKDLLGKFGNNNANISNKIGSMT